MFSFLELWSSRFCYRRDSGNILKPLKGNACSYHEEAIDGLIKRTWIAVANRGIISVRVILKRAFTPLDYNLAYIL